VSYIQVHDLHRFYASLLIAQRMPLEIGKETLGHS